MKRRKLFALLMTAAMAVSSMSMAVNVFAEEDTTEEAAESEEPAEGEPTAVTTVGPDDGTKYEMWSFVDLHNEFYGKMVEKWNEENPDKQIQVTFSTYPYSDMHNKLMMSLQPAPVLLTFAILRSDSSRTIPAMTARYIL